MAQWPNICFAEVPKFSLPQEQHLGWTLWTVARRGRGGGRESQAASVKTAKTADVRKDLLPDVLKAYCQSQEITLSWMDQ